jgi:hypothetical protein
MNSRPRAGFFYRPTVGHPPVAGHPPVEWHTRQSNGTPANTALFVDYIRRSTIS